MIKKSKIFILLTLLIIILFFIFYINSINKINIKKIDIININNFSLSGFNIEAYLELNNPTIFNYNTKKINYEIKINDFKTTNTITNITLFKKSTNIIIINQVVPWNMSFEIIKEILLNKETNLELSGNVILLDFPININKSFKTKIDISNKLNLLITENFINSSKETAKKIINVLKI
jgi:hypothetical protein